MGLPRQAQIESALILYFATIAKTLGIERSIAIGLKTLNGHERKRLTKAQAQGIDGSQMALLVDSRFAIKS
jgi:hypothetical protein